MLIKGTNNSGCCIVQMAIGAAGAQTLYAFNGKGKEEWKRVMLENFPEEEKALDKWLHLLAVTNPRTMQSAYSVCMDGSV